MDNDPTFVDGFDDDVVDDGVVVIDDDVDGTGGVILSTSSSLMADTAPSRTTNRQADSQARYHVRNGRIRAGLGRD